MMIFNSKKVRQSLLQIVAQPNYKPRRPKHFLKDLGLTSNLARNLRKLINAMVKHGELAYGKNRFVLPAQRTSPITATKNNKMENISPNSTRKSSTNLITGRFQRRPSGIGFVRPRAVIGDDVPVNDIFIPAHWTSDAASGDTVAVEIMKRRPKDDYGRSTKKHSKKNDRNQFRSDEDRGARGRVVEILQRASNRFVGTYYIEDGWGYIQIDGSVFKRKVPIGDAGAGSARTGDKIVVEMIKFPTPHNDGEAVIVEVLGSHGVPGLDTLLILRQFNLPDHFSDTVLNAARNEVEKFFKHFPDESITEKESVAKKLKSMNRLDLTDEIIITIDPADAKDFDDAVSLEKLDNGNWRLGVHIADVTHFVAKNSPLDKEAVNRATSVYLPDRVIPMLPEVLSNALASLQPDKIRFAKSVFMEYTPEGVRTHTEIYRSAIKSKQRFNYTEVQEFFDNPDKFQRKWKPEICELLTNLYEIMNVLRNKRFERGSLEMDIPETKIDLDDDGAVIGAHIYPYHNSNRVIEECMLAANESVAEFIDSKKIPFLRRIHSGPSIRKLRSFTDFIRSLEIADLDADDLYQDRFIIQQLLHSVRGTLQEYAVNFSLLRSMQKAVYSPEPEGHYALASACYCHFTSPIRRYPDLAVHRLLEEILDGKSPKPELRELVLLGEHCSDREQQAEEAERELVKLKLIDYMSKHIGEQIETVITKVETFGVFVMGLEIPAEGLIRIEALNDDFYRFDRNAKILIGCRSGNTLRIGSCLLVEIVRADPDARQIDFRMVKCLKTNKPIAKFNDSPIHSKKTKSKQKQKKEQKKSKKKKN
ncbi:MAG: ribonuclease R [Planctomycetaceae bacterium]|jgi:ribonuclease R|nr:ribonuclease R [Planctomycetaceae bacterium]